MNYPSSWEFRGICITAPKPSEVELFVRFIHERLAKDGINKLVLLTRYRYAFETHPECRGDDPISKSDVAAIKAACDEHGIELIPKMNLFGHQSDSDIFDTLLFFHASFLFRYADILFAHIISPILTVMMVITKTVYHISDNNQTKI